MFAILFAHFGIALLALATDGMVCYATRKRFQIVPSTFACLFWEIVLPMLIFNAWRLTRTFPLPTSPDTVL